MNYITPEQAGVSSAAIQTYIQYLEDNRIPTHSIIMMRGNDIFFENYWKPFNADFLHRMYSVSKSVVSLAVGFAVQDGLIDLDKEIQEYFPEECKAQPDEYMRRQTVKDMLMMSTAKADRWWFGDKPKDRVQYYFENPNTPSRPSGLFFRYDSTGSFVLGVLVERLTGMPFMDYLRGKLFDKIGVSEEAYCLKAPGGHSWGDSAVLCKPMDMLKIARFVMNGGSWDGEQLLDRAYVEAATSKLIDNYRPDAPGEAFGYGYLIWRSYDNSFFFNGMGSQLAICVPDKDIIMMFNADTQGRDPHAREILVEQFFRMIVRPASDEALAEDVAAQTALKAYADALELYAVKGEKTCAIAQKINGVTYAFSDNNPMGLKTVRFDFTEDGGVFVYENAQGKKELPFGLNKNAFGKFPQDGFADEIGTVPGNRRFACAASGAWVDDTKLHVKVQIIDTYFGVLDAVFGFKDNACSIVMQKTAEDFMNEYEGMATGYAV